MSAGTHQSTLNGAEAQDLDRINHVNGIAAVLWEVGADDRIPDDTEAQLEVVYRRSVKRGHLDGGAE